MNAFADPSAAGHPAASCLCSRWTSFPARNVTTAPMGQLPLVLIPAIVVPAFIILHLIALMQIRAGRDKAAR